jgi:hypothetical protein
VLAKPEEGGEGSKNKIHIRSRLLKKIKRSRGGNVTVIRKNKLRRAVKAGMDFSKEFEKFVRVTQPTLAFFIIKRRSYKKKKKIFILKHALKVAKPKNRTGKLFGIIKHTYFRNKRRKNRPGMQKIFHELIAKEVTSPKKSRIRKFKAQAHETIGRDAVNDLVFRRRLDNARSS